MAKFSEHEWTKEMFDEWRLFFKDFTDALTPPDSYSVMDNPNPMRSGFPRSDLSEEYLSDSDSALPNFNRRLEDESD